MDCEFLERVSMLIDGELSGEESRRVRGHIAACAVCRRAEQEFLLVRQQIRSYRSDVDLTSAERALRQITSNRAARWWEKKIALPVPVFAALVLLIVALAAWSLERPDATEREASRRAEKTVLTERTTEGQPDFSRFDHGARAVIYKTRRADAGSLEQ